MIIKRIVGFNRMLFVPAFAFVITVATASESIARPEHVVDAQDALPSLMELPPEHIHAWEQLSDPVVTYEERAAAVELLVSQPDVRLLPVFVSGMFDRVKASSSTLPTPLGRV